MFFYQMFAEISCSMIIIRTDKACIVSFGSLHNDRNAGFLTSSDDILDSVFKIQTACKYHRTVEVMKVRQIVDIHVALFKCFGIHIDGIAEKQKDIRILIVQRPCHTRDELTEDLRTPTGSKYSYLLLHNKALQNLYFIAADSFSITEFSILILQCR